MKSFSILFFVLFIIVSISATAQDIIVLKNGDEVKVKVNEVSVSEVKFKKWANLEGPGYTELKSNIFMIKYQNGTKDVFNTTIPAPSSAPTPATLVRNRDEEKKNAAQMVLENYMGNLFKSTAPFKYISYKKVNGVMLNVNGQSIYQIDFDFTIQVLRDVWLKGNNQTGFWNTSFSYSDTKPDLYASGERFLYETKLIPGRSVFTFGCKATFADSDNGFVFQKYEIKTVTDRGVQNLLNTVVATPPPPPVVNVPVNLSKFQGMFLAANKNYGIKIAEIKVQDEQNNISEFQNKILDLFSTIKRLSNPILLNVTENLEVVVVAKLGYKEMIRNEAPAYFSTATVTFSIFGTKDKNVLYSNTYNISNYSILSKGAATKVEANRNLIAYYLKDPIYQFVLGNFPIQGELIEIIEKNKKGDEAKLVKINRGSNDGVEVGYEFRLEDLGQEGNKTDLTVKNIFSDYAICKVNKNEKKIIELQSPGKPMKVKTKYKSELK